jgi:hypothetical protein
LKGGYYLNWIIKKWGVRMWTVSVWLRMGSSSEWAVVRMVTSFQVLKNSGEFVGWKSVSFIRGTVHHGVGLYVLHFDRTWGGGGGINFGLKKSRHS